MVAAASASESKSTCNTGPGKLPLGSIYMRPYSLRYLSSLRIRRACGQAEETIIHLLSACSLMAVSVYLYHYNLVVSVLHWHLSKIYSKPLHGLLISLHL